MNINNITFKQLLNDLVNADKGMLMLKVIDVDKNIVLRGPSYEYVTCAELWHERSFRKEKNYLVINYEWDEEEHCNVVYLKKGSD